MTSLKQQKYSKTHKFKVSQRKFKHSEKGKAVSRRNCHIYRQKHKEEIKLYKQRCNDRNRLAVFNAYGGSFCTWCGETDISTLTVDHINNDGAEHRRQIMTGTKRPGGGTGFYRWIVKNNFPPGLQILCASCQLAKVKNNGVLPLSRKGVGPDEWFERAGINT